MRIGVDAGGTFTDFVVLRDDGSLEAFKLRSDPSDPAGVILRGIRQAIGESTRGQVVHGSTVATNALIERKGVRTGFVASPGFGSLLAIGRQNRAELYSLRPPERVNLVPDELCFEWSGDKEALHRFIAECGAQSVAICLLGAYRDASGEDAAVEAIGATDLYVSCSSKVAPEYREYERASTTVLNAYVGPLMERYLARLELECPFPVSIMQSNGGLLQAKEAGRQAVRTILSGPAGGVVGAREMARAAGFARAIAFDMGGTSTDISLVEEPLRFATEAWVEGLPVRVPMLDIHTLGAGGGSLASVDVGGRLRVGPESAGSRPGPACYGTGEQATVTDAHVALGRIIPDRFLDGEMPIDRERSRKAISVVAASLGVSIEEAADAIVRVANSNMERGMRVVSVEHGEDPRSFPLVAFGGGGGLHACEIADDLGMDTVIFPQYASLLSALGMLVADRMRDYAIGALAASDYAELFTDLRKQALEATPGAELEEYADIRYKGQSYELTCRWEREDPRRPFEEAYRRIYGFTDPAREIELVTVRVRLIERTNRSFFERAADGPNEPAAGWNSSLVFHEGKWRPFRVGTRASVVRETAGPLLITAYGSTIFVPPGWTIVNERGILIGRRAHFTEIEQ